MSIIKCQQQQPKVYRFRIKKTMEDSFKRRSYNFRCYYYLFYDSKIFT